MKRSSSLWLATLAFASFLPQEALSSKRWELKRAGTGDEIVTIIGRGGFSTSTHALEPVNDSVSLQESFPTHTRKTALRQLHVTLYCALANMLLFMCRPDPFMPFVLRIPRLIWELCLAIVASQAMSETAPLSATRNWSMLLGIMTLSTGLVDVFLWAPLFATLLHFDKNSCTENALTCTGRLAVVLQSSLTGLVYLMTSIVALKIQFMDHR